MSLSGIPAFSFVRGLVTLDSILSPICSSKACSKTGTMTCSKESGSRTLLSGDFELVSGGCGSTLDATNRSTRKDGLVPVSLSTQDGVDTFTLLGVGILVLGSKQGSAADNCEIRGQGDIALRSTVASTFSA